jgi:hypothetical protein
MPDFRYLDAGREFSLITGNVPRIAEYADYFEILIEGALSADESIKFAREAAEAVPWPRAITTPGPQTHLRQLVPLDTSRGGVTQYPEKPGAYVL